MKSLLTLFILTASLFSAWPDTTINSTNCHAWGANIGWMDCSGDTTNGAVVNDYCCSGYIYAANIGWICLGSGSPTNCIRHQNQAASDFGVNNDSFGNLGGYAWGANIGWVAFETNGAPSINLDTGEFSGYVWSANCGWISLSNTSASVQTDHILSGPLSTNGLPIPWLFTYFGTTNIDPNSDPAGSGMSVGADYEAGLTPTDSNSVFCITAGSFVSGGTNTQLTWTSVMTRRYYIMKSTNLAWPWTDSGLGMISPDGARTTRTFEDVSAPQCFYTVRVVRPLP